MQSKPSGSRLFFGALALWLAVSLACTLGAPDQPKATPTQPNPTIKTGQVGFDRSNPFPRSQTVSAPNWDVTVMDVLRGAQAWDLIHAASPKNDPAPQGREFILLKLHVKSTYADSEPHNINNCDFDVTGERLVMYTCSATSTIRPEPKLDVDLTSGAEAEGWIAFLITAGEKNLILMVNESYNPDKGRRRYIAIDPGASIAAAPNFNDITPTPTGSRHDNPAFPNQMLVTENWEFTALKVVRGDTASTMIADANPYNAPPADGMEYLLVDLQVRYIGGPTSIGSIDISFFHTTGSAGEVFNPPIAVEPYPPLDVFLFSGAQYEGWVVLQIPKGETGILLVIEPFLDLTIANQRYIALFPD